MATQDTVTQLRAAIRKLLAALDLAASPLAAAVRAALLRDDEYSTVGKPPCDWDDKAARAALVDALVRDASAALAVLNRETLPAGAVGAAELLALVASQDIQQGDDGVFRIVVGVAKDRVISTVDPEARHGHKSRNRRFDGFKTHLPSTPTPSSSTRWPSPRPTCPTATRWATCSKDWPTRMTNPRSSVTRPMPTALPARHSAMPASTWWPRSPGAQRYGAVHQGPFQRRPGDAECDLSGRPARRHQLHL